MLGEKSTYVSMVRCLAFVILLLFNIDSNAQTPVVTDEKTNATAGARATVSSLDQSSCSCGTRDSGG